MFHGKIYMVSCRFSLKSTHLQINVMLICPYLTTGDQFKDLTPELIKQLGPAKKHMAGVRNLPAAYRQEKNMNMQAVATQGKADAFFDLTEFD